MRHLSTQLALASAFVLIACGGKSATGDGACNSAADCDPGEVCIVDACQAVCRTDSDCTVDGEVCNGDFCEAGTRDEAPQITSVDGNGAPNPTGGDDADHYVGSGMVINGQNLAGVSVQLVGTEGSFELEVCEPGDTTVGVHLPDTLTGGTYTLSVVSQGGQCSTTLDVLRGSPGTNGNDGATGPTGPSGPAGAPGVPCASCVDSATVGDGTLEVVDMNSSIYGGNGSATTLARSDHSHGVWAIKPADEARNGTARPDDADLTVQLGANQTWAFEAELQISIGANSDYAVAFGAPTYSDYAAQFWYTNVDRNNLSGVTRRNSPSNALSVDHSNAGQVAISVSGIIHTTAAGALVLQWGQRIANGGADAVLQRGSFLRAQRID